MNIVIAEDDLISRKVLNHFISSIPSCQIVGEATNGEQLIRHLVTEKPDVAIVDIGMPILNGMDAIKSCKAMLPDLQVIFLTGYDEYAVEAFDINAVDYIVKPLELERFKQALGRASILLNAKKVANQTMVDVTKKNYEEKLILKNYNNYSIIRLEEIIFIEKLERKTYIHSHTNIYQNTEALTDLLEKLPLHFIQSHRSYIININHLSTIESKGQTYFASFFNYDKLAKISKHQLREIQHKLKP